MHSKVHQLLELQTLDQEIAELQDQLDRYPRIWEEIKGDLRKKKDALDRAAAAVVGHQEERARIEKDLRTSTETLKKYQTQQMMVKTSKELAAITRQIEDLTANIARMEERGTSLLTDDTKHEKLRVAAEKEFEETRAYAAKERERIRDQVNLKKDRRDALLRDRERLVKKTDDEALRLYDRIRKRWPRDPVVPVRNSSCMGCHFAVLPNRMVEVHQADEIAMCDNCGRILSEDETFESPTQAAQGVGA